MKYDEHRDNIKSGDLLVWSTRKIETFSDILDYIVRTFTMSEYNHVGIAWSTGDRKMVIEAVPPKVRIYPLSRKSAFYHIPMNIQWEENYERYLLEKIGDNYSIMEAVLSYFSRPKENNYWQCAELSSNFYMKTGIDLKEGYTPSKIVNLLLTKYDKPFIYVESNK